MMNWFKELFSFVGRTHAAWSSIAKMSETLENDLRDKLGLPTTEEKPPELEHSNGQKTGRKGVKT